MASGQRPGERRLDIALGLIHSPELLFLDEPSTGLDPQSRANLWRHIHELRQSHGTTIFVTTHYLEEADRHAERVLVMDKGRVIADDTAPALKSNLAGDVIGLGFRDSTDEVRARAVIDEVARPSAINPAPSGIELTVNRGELILPALLRALDGASIPVVSATLRQPTLDDVFLALTGRSLRDAGDAPADSEEEEEAPSPVAASIDEASVRR